MVFFYMFPLEIEQKSVYNQRKLVFFYMFPLIIAIITMEIFFAVLQLFGVLNTSNGQITQF